MDHWADASMHADRDRTFTLASGLLASSFAMMVALLPSPSLSRMWGVLHTGAREQGLRAMV